MHITGGMTINTRTIAGIRVSLCQEYESGDYRFQATLLATGEIEQSGMVSLRDKRACQYANNDEFFDIAADAFDIISLGDLFQCG